MHVTIDTTDKQLDWAATGIERIAQNVKNLITTKKYEVAYDRTLGINPSYIDQPLQIAIAEVTAQIYAVIEEREPRARVVSVDFISIDVLGNLQFKVVIEV